MNGVAVAAPATPIRADRGATTAEASRYVNTSASSPTTSETSVRVTLKGGPNWGAPPGCVARVIR